MAKVFTGKIFTGKIVTALLTGLIAITALAACQNEGSAKDLQKDRPLKPATGIPADQRNGKTEVIVLGMIHGGHRNSKTYPLSRIENVVRTIAPDLILTEIPPGRIDAAISSYRETGKVTEPRTRAFPEYTDVIIPLQAELGYAMKGTAAWTQAMASSRRQTLNSIKNDPARAHQWQIWQDAQAAFRNVLDGRGTDPLYIHTAAYDAAVEARYQPHIRYFDKDIGAGGWQPINRAHWANMAAELDAVSGQGQRVLITYGGFHKYWILRVLAQRDDVIITQALPFFANN